MFSFEQQVLNHCFAPYEGTFAGGQEANNKLDIERLCLSPVLRARAASYVMDVIRKNVHMPDLLVAVPYGANWMVGDICRSIPGVSPLYLEKTQKNGSKELTLLDEGEQALEDARTIGIVDDVLNRRTNTLMAYDLIGSEQSQKIVGIFGFWDRNPAWDNHLDIPVDAAIKHEIPDMLPPDSQLWRYAR